MHKFLVLSVLLALLLVLVTSQEVSGTVGAAEDMQGPKEVMQGPKEDMQGQDTFLLGAYYPHYGYGGHYHPYPYYYPRPYYYGRR